MSRLIGIQAEALPEWYATIEDAFRLMAVKSNGRWEVSDIVRFVANRDMQLWVSMEGDAVEAVLLTEIINYPRKKALRFSACVGRDWQKWSGFHTPIMEWGRENGCDLFEVYAPRKWRACFPEFWEYHVMMEYADAERG